MIFMIAIIKDTSSKLIGFRLLDTLTMKTMEVVHKIVLDNLIQKKICIENLVVVNNIIKGVNGSIDRYPVLSQQLTLIGKSSVTILGKVTNDTYICASYKGVIQAKGALTEKQIIEYVTLNGLANGKVVNNHISAIEGSYKSITIPLVTQPQSIKVSKTLEEQIKDYRIIEKKNNLIELDFIISDSGVSCKAKDIYVSDMQIFNSPNLKNRHCEIPNFVTSIEANAFTDRCTCLTMERVEIPLSVLSIGDGAFRGCKGLKEIMLERQSGLKSIGKKVFENSGLEWFCIPSSVEVIESFAFNNCHALRSIVIPSSVTSIKRCAFSGCDSLKEVKLSQSITLIEDMAFAYCTALTVVTLDARLKYLSKGLFADCELLKSITIPSSVEVIGDEVFLNCKSLSTLEIPSSVNSLGDCTFKGCIALQSIVLPSSLKALGHSVFRDCKLFTSIYLSANITSIHSYAFFGCKALKTVTTPLGSYADSNRDRVESAKKWLHN